MTSQEIQLMRTVSDYFYNNRRNDPKADELMDLLALTANAAAARNNLDLYSIKLIKMGEEELEDLWKHCIFLDKKNRKKTKPSLQLLFAKEVQNSLINRFFDAYEVHK
jgi:hypothetical protein